MAFKTGTAANSIDFWNKLLDFLTNDPTLIAEGGAWQIVKTYVDAGQPRVVLKGVGASGADSIYVALARTDSVDTDANNIRIMGMTGYLPDATAWNQHVGMSPEVRIWLDGNPMKFWFVANARRFAIVANMSTVYQAAYAGFFLPYANPLAYPYPMFIGGSATTATVANGGVSSWRSQSDYHAHFPYSSYNNISGVTAQQRSTGYMLTVDGAWVPAAMSTLAAVSIGPRFYNAYDEDAVDRWQNNNTYNYNQDSIGSNNIRGKITQNYGGGYTLMPLTLIQTTPSVQNLGILEGIYSAPGVGNGAENIVKIDSIDHLIVQNVWRTTTYDYWALGLE
ncbi:hypothetical protein G3A39_39365 [Paraburkholderia aspalathi]|nr:hypothetical protein [Paraburkholderia aspalathi]